MIAMRLPSFHGSSPFASVSPISFSVDSASVNTSLGRNSFSGFFQISRASPEGQSCVLASSMKLRRSSSSKDSNKYVMHCYQVHRFIFLFVLVFGAARRDIAFFCWQFKLKYRFQCFGETNLDQNKPNSVSFKTGILTILLFDN